MNESEVEVCDHTVGYLHNWVTQSELKDRLESEAYGWNSHSSTLNSFARGNKKALREDYTAREFLDRRKGHMTVFNYCPYCGEKIDWKEIKKAI